MQGHESGGLQIFVLHRLSMIGIIRRDSEK